MRVNARADRDFVEDGADGVVRIAATQNRTHERVDDARQRSGRVRLRGETLFQGV